MLALSPRRVSRLEKADLPQQRTRDRQLDRDHRLEILNGHVHDPGSMDEPQGPSLPLSIEKPHRIELGYSVVFERLPDGFGGYCRASDKTLGLAEGKPANHRVHTHVHELAHALLAAEPDDDLALDYAQEELVVESVTYTVAGALGLRVDGYAIPYLTSWSQDTDLGVIEQAAALIDRLAKRIEDSVLAVAPRHGEANLEDAAPADD
jgi:hypothetical protein